MSRVRLIPGKLPSRVCAARFDAGMIPKPESFYVTAALGWLELGSPVEALAELSRLDGQYQRVPAVMELRWQALARLERWVESLDVALELCHVSPDHPEPWLHHAVSLYRLGRTAESWELLLKQAGRFPDCWVIPYDLSCYACQLDKLDEGRAWFRKALGVGDGAQIKQIALKDPDLERLWPELEQIKPAS